MRTVTALRDLLLGGLILLTAGLVIVRLQREDGEAVSGRAVAIDGDTLSLSGRRIRLAGIDAPEIGQTCGPADGLWPCGVAARDRLAGLVAGSETACLVDGRDRYGRGLAVCRADSDDINATMVRSGHAVAFGGYAAEEATARAARHGLWAGPFDPPKLWRQRHGGMDEAPAALGDWMRWLRKDGI